MIKKKKSLLTLYLQIIISVCCIVLLIMYFINNKYLPYLIMTLGVDLLVIGYNNMLFYKRKNLTVSYMFFGVVLFIYGILKLLGVL